LVSLILVVLAAGWSDFPDAPPATKTRPPKSSQRREALEEFQTLLGQWQKERLDFTREQSLQLKAEGHLEFSRGEPGDAAEPVRGFNKVIEVKKGGAPGATRTGRGKVIEFAPREKLELDLEEAEAEAAARQQECAKNPKKCAAEKAKREKVESANDAFDEAIEVNFEKRRAQIEAEAAKMQAAVNEARQREANRQAKKLGGSVDEEGNFEDDDLKAEPPPRKPD
jgi:hypothetical protein